MIMDQSHCLYVRAERQKILLHGDAVLDVLPEHALRMRRGIHFMSRYILEGDSFEALLIYFTDVLLERLLVQLANVDPLPATAQDYALVGTSPP
jgi:hypothetical protein